MSHRAPKRLPRCGIKLTRCCLRQMFCSERWTLTFAGVFQRSSLAAAFCCKRGDGESEAALPKDLRLHLPSLSGTAGRGHFLIGVPALQRGARCEPGLSCCSQVGKAQDLPCQLYPIKKGCHNPLLPQKRAPRPPVPTLK